jgi:hypothetical protein
MDPPEKFVALVPSLCVVGFHIEPLYTRLTGRSNLCIQRQAGRRDAEQFHVTSHASIGGRLAVYEQIGDAMDAINLGGKAQP